MTTVLCAGDRFITAAGLAAAARRSLGPDAQIVTYETRWPDEPFRSVAGVREAAGDPGELASLAAGADIVLTHLAPITEAVLNAGDRLRLVGVTRGGPVNVDLPAATRNGTAVAYLPGRNLNAVAEFALGAMIAVTRGIGAGARSLAAGTWDASWFRFERSGPELRASTVGLVGVGAVGLRVAELLTAFGAQVLASDPFADENALRGKGIEPSPLDGLLAGSDIVSLHARLTDDTRGLFGAAEFAAMRPGSFLVNTARGELVDHAALAKALETGHLAGAALDVFDPEPPAADDPLVRRSDVLATPHLAGSSRRVATESATRIADAAGEFLRTGSVQHCANPDWVHHAQ